MAEHRDETAPVSPVPDHRSATGPWLEAVLSSMDACTVAVRTPEGDWSGAELLARTAGAAALLAGLAPPGAAVPALLGAGPAQIALALGGACSHHPLAPLGTRLTVPELAPLVRALDSPVLIADGANAGLAERTAAAAGTRAVVVDHVAAAGHLDMGTTADTVVLVLHTSGTTGRPKAVEVRDAALHHRSRAYQAEMGLGAGDLYCSTGGFHHTGGIGMVFVALGCGAGVVPFPRFSVEAWRALAASEPTCALLVPTMIDQLLEAGALAAVPLRGLHYGTAPIHPDTLRAALRVIPATRFTQAYGMTEGGPIAMLGHDDHLRALAGATELLTSVGRPAAGVEIRIDAPAADGVGELEVRAGQIFQPGPDGWLRTGDLAVLDRDGYLFLRGRTGDTIIRGGENIYPLEVERVLEMHPGVAEAAVVGVADRRWGQTVKAVVVPVDPQRPPAEEGLAAHVRAHLAAWKVPVEWEYEASLPRNPAGKLLRRLLG